MIHNFVVVCLSQRGEVDSDQEDVKGFGQHRGHLLVHGVTSYGLRAIVLGKSFVFSSPPFYDIAVQKPGICY